MKAENIILSRRRAPPMQKARSLRAAKLVRTSVPAWLSRGTYLVLGCFGSYAVIRSLRMMEDTAIASVWKNSRQPQRDTVKSASRSSSVTENKVIRNAMTLTDTKVAAVATNAEPNKKKPTNVKDSSPIVVAYVVAITGCGHDTNVRFEIAEGAAVLRHSIHQNSVRSGNGRYDYRLYAFHHPEAAVCAETLADLDYAVQERDIPVPVSEIEGDFLRERIVKNGCCGEKELIKLEAFTLTDHAIVVLLDLDVLVMKPLDRLFDFILDSKKLPDADDLLLRTGRIATTKFPAQIDLLYTTDYAMVSPGRRIKPTQGGFVVLRPNRTVYDDFVAIIRKGDFRDGHGGNGWGGKTGRFWGAMTFQGLIPYYYQILHPGRAVELNWCVWDNMCSPSRDKKVDENDVPIGECFTQQENCEDCRNRPVTDVGLIHFTVCQKPWTCQLMGKDDIYQRLCRDFHHMWFLARSDMEKSWGRTGWGSGDFDSEHFFGYCHGFGKNGYELLAKPYGAPVHALATVPPLIRQPNPAVHAL